MKKKDLEVAFQYSSVNRSFRKRMEQAEEKSLNEQWEIINYELSKRSYKVH